MRELGLGGPGRCGQSRCVVPQPMISDIAPLQGFELFRELAAEELSKLRLLCSDLVVVEGAFLVREGDRVSYVYVVAEGQIALQKAIRVPHAKRSRRTTITICRPGQVVGWSALVEPYKCNFSAVAWESSRLIRVDSSPLRKALDMYPKMGYNVMKSLSAIVAVRLRQTTDALVSEPEATLARLRL